MNKEIAELNTRFTKLGNLHSKRIADTRKAILKLIEAVDRHISADEKREIKKLIGG